MGDTTQTDKDRELDSMVNTDEKDTMQIGATEADKIKAIIQTLDRAASKEERHRLTKRIKQPFEIEEKLKHRTTEDLKLQKQRWNTKKMTEILQRSKKPIEGTYSTVSELTVGIAESMLQDWFDLENVPHSTLESAKINIARELYKLIG